MIVFDYCVTFLINLVVIIATVLKSYSSKKLVSQNIGKSKVLIQTDSLLEKGVEYLAIINKKGRIEDTIYKNDINLNDERKQVFFLSILLHNSMQRDFDEDFGEVNYTITDRGNSKFVSVPTRDGILFAKLNKSIDSTVFIKKILGILKFSNGAFSIRDEIYQ
jgi:hypothetical protein